MFQQCPFWRTFFFNMCGSQNCTSAKTYNIAFRFSIVFVVAVRKDIRPEETFTHTCFILEKPNHCFGIFSCVHGRGPQRHTGWRNIYCQISYTLTHTQSLQSAKTYNIAFRFSLFFVAAVHKDIRPMAAVRKDIRAEETFTVRSPTL